MARTVFYQEISPNNKVMDDAKDPILTIEIPENQYLDLFFSFPSYKTDLNYYLNFVSHNGLGVDLFVLINNSEHSIHEVLNRNSLNCKIIFYKEEQIKLRLKGTDGKAISLNFRLFCPNCFDEHKKISKGMDHKIIKYLELINKKKNSMIIKSEEQLNKQLSTSQRSKRISKIMTNGAWIEAFAYTIMIIIQLFALRKLIKIKKGIVV